MQIGMSPQLILEKWLKIFSWTSILSENTKNIASINCYF